MSNEFQKIKDKLCDNDNIERLLESVGCEYVKREQRGFLVTAQLPDRFYSTNKRSVQVKTNEFMSCVIRSKGGFSGDIFNLVSYLQFDKNAKDLQSHLPKSKEFICKIFGWTQFLNSQSDGVIVKDYTASLKEILNGKKRKKEIKPNPVLEDDVMNEYYIYNDKPLPYAEWIDEGISYQTQVMYGVGFCFDSKRVVFPLKNKFGQIVGVKGRIMKDSDDPERKYLYLHKCNNRYEWFNWHYAHTYILESKRVYILESEKSTMKLFDNGIYNSLAIGSSDISIEQAEIVKKLGLDIEIVLCYDKGIKIEDIQRNAGVFRGRKVFAMFDTDNLLDNKSAPIDKGIGVWSKMVDSYIFPIPTK